jgi:hypothetical protein
VPVAVVGEVGGDALSVAVAGQSLSLRLAELRLAHSELERLFP